jgi:3-phosphoshikimate 1-carboxyvinyltransferase
MVFLMLAVLVEMNFLVFSFRVPVNNHAANRAPEAKPRPIANVLYLLILLINLIFCLNVTLHAKKSFSTCNFPNSKLKVDLNTIFFKQNSFLSGCVNNLPASKSISNRVLILNALSANRSILHNLSDANDTQLMLKLIQAENKIIDVEDAGTTMRFLTAYFSVTNQHKIITGTERMKERPIGILVDALRSLGANIEYKEKPGYPPLETIQFSGQKTPALRIRGDVSSQFISALMMVAPSLPHGLTLMLEGKVGSRPYIEMTASLMKLFGVKCDVLETQINIPSQQYHPSEFTVESDWSGASYWFAFAALAKDADILLPRLSMDSLQGDSVIRKIMETIGVQSIMEGTLMKLSKIKNERTISWDFTHCPDLAQTVAVVCAAKGIEGNFTGLQSLRIKETDRIAALQTELRKIGADFVEEGEQWKLIPTSRLPAKAYFNTYKDHRMAMAFAPLATLMDLEIENPQVVRKSYPKFWDDMKIMGVQMA